MKIEILTENLSKGVMLAARMVSGKAQLPVLANILIEAKKSGVRMAATNLETGVNLKLKAKVEEEGKITVPAKIMSELVGSLPTGTVELSTEGEKLKVSGSGYKAVVNGIGAEEFPEIPSLGAADKGIRISLKKNIFEEVVGRVSLAAGTDEARPIFTGVKIEIEGNKMRLAATDGYRLSVDGVAGISGIKEKLEMVVPAKALSELAKICKGQDGDEVIMAVTAKEQQLIMAIGDVEVITRLLAGDFPDFDKIVPTSSKTKVEIDKEELIQAVRAAAIFAKDSANIVRFSISDKGIKISANAPQVGENQVEVAGKKEGEDNEIAFNSRYLQEFLGAMEGGKIRLEVSGALSPGVFRLENNKEFLHIIMPVRVQG